MPAPTTCQELLDLVRQSELISLPRLDAFLKKDRPVLHKQTPAQLATQLVSAGLVTQFQAEQFLQGKWRGFTIGKYKVLERLGSGGMGTVYLCEHLMMGRKVAVKVLPTSQATNPSALGRFYREARAAGLMDHPNLVKAHDVDSEGGLHYLVMDYVDGSSLHEIVTKFGPLSPVRAAHYIKMAAAGLQAAHQAGLIHRDVKPANILLERNGNIRVLDLGLARFYNDNVDNLTLKYDDNNVLGTADYVSPEQAQDSHEVDIRTDIYSLGATLYFCLTGQPPFPEGKIAQKLIWHQMREPAGVRTIRPEIPESMAAIVTKMMAKEPTQRYQTPEEVIKALAPWTNQPVGKPTEEEMPKLSLAATGISPPSEPPSSRPLPKDPSTRRMSPSGKLQDGTIGAAQQLAGPSKIPGPSKAQLAQQETPRAAKTAQAPKPQTATAPPAHSPTRLLQMAVKEQKKTEEPGYKGLWSLLLSALLLLVMTGSGVGVVWWLYASGVTFR